MTILLLETFVILVPFEGQALLLKVFADILQEHSKARVMIVGEGELKDELMCQVILPLTVMQALAYWLGNCYKCGRYGRIFIGRQKWFRDSSQIEKTAG
jgi:hypothetical protein